MGSLCVAPAVRGHTLAERNCHTCLITSPRAVIDRRGLAQVMRFNVTREFYRMPRLGVYGICA
jgi:hypothetical protein